MNKITATIIGGVLVLSSVPIADKLVVTDKEWRVEIKEAALDIRTDKELDEMLVAHEEKYQRVLENNKVERCPDCIRWEMEKYLVDSFGLSGQELEDEVDKQVAEAIAHREEEVENLANAIEQIKKAKELK